MISRMGKERGVLATFELYNIYWFAVFLFYISPINTIMLISTFISDKKESKSDNSECDGQNGFQTSIAS